MENILKRKLGKSGIKVSPMGLGCWAIGGNIFMQGLPLGWSTVDDTESLKALQRGIEMGVNFIDTADMYGTGHSEKLVGEAIKGKRDKVVIATKFGMTFEPGSREILSMEGDGSPEYIRKAVEDSLSRLQTDYIDLYQLHLGEYPLDKAQQTRDALEDLVKAGKIRSYGWSTDDFERAAFFAEGENCGAIQHIFNLFVGNTNILRLCEEKKLASINRGPLAMGLLTGKYTEESKLPDDDVRSILHLMPDEYHIFFAESKPVKKLLEQIDDIREILKSNGRTLAQGALAWLWARSENTIPIPGFKTVKQVEENAGALQFGPLTESQMAEIDAILHKNVE
jgi:aryl-alcohol dehydrogenase-like predicted oxidoreductase